MAQPSDGINRYDLSTSYTEFSLASNRLGFVGMQVLPPLNRPFQGKTDFRRIKPDSLVRTDKTTLRAADGSYRRDTFEWTKDSYDLDDHGLEETVSDHDLDRWGDVLRQEGISAERALDGVLRGLEQDVANAVFTNTWAHKTAAGTAFTNRGTSQPIDILEAAIKSVRNRIGLKPNSLVIPEDRWRDMIFSAQVEDKITSTTNNDPKKLTTSGFQSLFPEFENIIICAGVDALRDNEQDAVAFDSMWDNTMMMVCHINDDGMDGDLESVRPNIGRTIYDVNSKQPLPGVSEADHPMIIMEEYREDKVRGSVIRARNYRGIKILHQEAGELITGIG